MDLKFQHLIRRSATGIRNDLILTCTVRLGESNRSVCISLVLARLIGAISNSVEEVGIRAVTLDIAIRTMELI